MSINPENNDNEKDPAEIPSEELDQITGGGIKGESIPGHNGWVEIPGY